MSRTETHICLAITALVAVAILATLLGLPGSGPEHVEAAQSFGRLG